MKSQSSHIDLERRKAVMSRSVKLGHCVCNTRQGCPCETFRLHNVCPCAGEKMPVSEGPVALTRHVRKAGCASKIGQSDLLKIISRLPPITNPDVLVGTAAGDDAGVYKINDEMALVQTVDVFTPCVDGARLFGQIAAANSVSDVYAMGGTPLSALSVVGFPIDTLDGDVLAELLLGGREKLDEANCALIGGHSWQDEEIKLGFAITGLIHPAQVVKRGAAQAGDALVLTKPLGGGMISFGAQIGAITAEALDDAGRVMATLNRDAAMAMVKYKAHAATDITGFGLAGHLVEMVRTSGCSCRIELSRLPVYRAVPECLSRGILSGAIERNQAYAMGWVWATEPEGEPLLPVLYDPQTSGGLLVSLPAERALDMCAELQALGHKETRIIGEVIPCTTAESRIVVEGTTLDACRGPANAVGAPARKET